MRRNFTRCSSWFALIGDELIEGTLSEGRLNEQRRIRLSR